MGKGKRRKKREKVSVSTLHEALNPAQYQDPRDFLEYYYQWLRDPGSKRQSRHANKHLRDVARSLVATNPYAAGLLDALKTYVVGCGFDYCLLTDSDANSDDQDKLAAWLDGEFWWEVELEVFGRAVCDGECFLRAFIDESGVPTFRFLEPEDVATPEGYDSDTSWVDGVHYSPGDARVVVGYGVGGVEVPADEVFHLKRNASLQAARGVTDFQPVISSFESALDLLNSAGMGEANRQSLSYIRQHVGASKSEIQALRAEDLDDTYQRPTPSGSTRTVYVKSTEPGTVADITEGMEYKEPPHGDGQSAELITQLILRSCAVRWRVPQWVLTGDSSESSYAAALVANGPLVQTVRTEQKQLTMFMGRLVQWAVEVILESDDVDVEVTAQPPEAKSELDQLEVLKAALEMGLCSKRTASEKLGFNFDDEATLISRESGPPISNGSLKSSNGESFSSTPSASYARVTR